MPVREQFPVALPPAEEIVRVEGHETARRLVGPVLLVTDVNIVTVPLRPDDEAGRPATVTETWPDPPEEIVTLVVFVVILTPAT